MRGKRMTLLLIVVVMLLFVASPALAVEEGDNPLASLGINLGFMIAQLVNFGLLFGLLTVFLWGPITNMLDARAEKIAKGLDDANAAANARRNAEAEADKILSQARTEASQVIEEARGRGDEVAKTIENEAREEAERIRQEARTAGQAERNTELANLRGQVVQISVAVAERLLNENLDQAKQKQIIDNFFTRLPEGAKSLSGDVEVVSAMPLEDAEQNRIRSELGVDNVEFTVEPAILGGLVIRSDERVIDGSVRRDLNEMRARLN